MGHINPGKLMSQIKSNWKQGKSEGFDSCGWPSDFGQRDIEIAWMTMKNNHLQMLKSDPYLQFLGLCNLEIWRIKTQEELHSGEQ